MDAKQKLIDLADQRATLLEAAEAALEANNVEKYDSVMEQVKNMNADMARTQALVDEQARVAASKQPTPAEARDAAGERGNALMKGEPIALSVTDLRREVFNQTTLASEFIVEPAGADSNIQGLIGSHPSSIVDQVDVRDLTGMGSFTVPYTVSEMEATVGRVKAQAGKKRPDSTSPSFDRAQVNPYEMNITDYVDRNISRLSPVAYYNTIHGMAMRAMRRKLAELIYNGDGQAAPEFFGIKTAKSFNGNNICAAIDLSALDENVLDEFFYAYGSDEAIGQNAQLYLPKADLKALGKIRDTDKRKVFKVSPTAGNPNTGTIEDGGVSTLYTIAPSLTALSGATAGAAPIQTMIYGDPKNFLLGLFGQMTIRVDESVMAKERMLTILGDAMVGGNVVVHHGFVIGTVPKKAAGTSA